MTPGQELDAKVAALLNMPPGQVAMYRDEWQRSPMSSVVKTALAEKLRGLIAERDRKLRGCKEEELKKLQGEIFGLELAITVLTTPIVS